MPDIAILGAGFAGIAAARLLHSRSADYVVYEKDATAGGHARSHAREGFLFDEGPHVSFTKRPEVAALLAEAVSGQFTEQQADVRSYFHGDWVRHPVQTNLRGLPILITAKSVVDFVRARLGAWSTPENYADWCYQNFGKTIAETFIFPYTLKYWTVEAERLAMDWAAPRMYSPSFRELLRGSVWPHRFSHHYLTRFRYPNSGGFGAYGRGLAAGIEIAYGKEVHEIDLDRRALRFADSYAANYDAVVSSLPLSCLVGMLTSVPEDVRAAARTLVCTSVVLVNLGFRRPQRLLPHWMYFYDRELVFARASQPHLLSSANVPQGKGSLQLEVYFSADMPLPVGEVIDVVVKQLARRNLVEAAEIELAFEMRVEYANVICTTQRKAAVHLIRKFLAKNQIFTCGRYGDWDYYWTDDSILSGWRAAETALRVVGARS